MIRIAILTLLLTGCATKGETILSTVAVKPDPFKAECRAECRIPCTESPTPIKAGDDGYAPDRMALELARIRDTCEFRRDSCVQCIDRSIAAGVIR